MNFAGDTDLSVTCTHREDVGNNNRGGSKEVGDEANEREDVGKI